MRTGNTSFLSRHFYLQELADGVFAVIHRPGGQAISNAGLVDLGNKLVVFDAFLSPQAAIDLKLLAEDLFHRPVDILVNSHHHNDHTWGNQAFHYEVELISTSETRSLMDTAAVDEQRWYRDHGEDLLRTLRDRGKPGAAGETANAGLWQQFVEVTMDVLPRVRLRPATLTFNNRLSLHGSWRTAELVHIPGGHTNGDLVMLLPQDGVLFAGDLVNVDCHPFLPESQPGKARSALERILAMGARQIVPGHGPVGSPENVAMLLNYLDALEACIRQKLAENPAFVPNNALKVPEVYRAWEFPEFYNQNAEFVARSLASQDALLNRTEAA